MWMTKEMNAKFCSFMSFYVYIYIFFSLCELDMPFCQCITFAGDSGDYYTTSGVRGDGGGCGGDTGDDDSGVGST